MTRAVEVTAILASVTIILGGLVAVVRFLYKIATQIRDNTDAIDRIERRLADHEDSHRARR